jgi:hypothetical protein
MPECTNIEPHPEEPDTLILTFEQRYQAETVSRDSCSRPTPITHLRDDPNLYSSSTTLVKSPTPVHLSSLGSRTMPSVACQLAPQPKRQTPMLTLTPDWTWMPATTIRLLLLKRMSRWKLMRTIVRLIWIWMWQMMWISGCKYRNVICREDLSPSSTVVFPPFPPCFDNCIERGVWRQGKE